MTHLETKTQSQGPRIARQPCAHHPSGTNDGLTYVFRGPLWTPVSVPKMAPARGARSGWELPGNVDLTWSRPGCPPSEAPRCLWGPP